MSSFKIDSEKINGYVSELRVLKGEIGKNSPVALVGRGKTFDKVKEMLEAQSSTAQELKNMISNVADYLSGIAAANETYDTQGAEKLRVEGQNIC